ncbi:CheY-like chemotaxis protein/anti-sigma regulatory factor (Ser/Thr protein kinase) [Allocatelliglobosispora scoriae]|uniref:CheY-like chemotaxis protein/anti-sigma regulatory factor (Ser/Thr protein kinase) n=1 Tax=Allocatelliglobosispora scoriae TaxID=643052 RepID=A0A841C0Q5_9ACTN|nr:SpoIIE family protein phosphatase [Allocatelliglobosispora scoriae]MBB5873436.1 CheY-like chemotaxis protein/anti-sigma regulatory factor (Ser/Thr protein kinase) [Allocatelliglobosispora scoriae]
MSADGNTILVVDDTPSKRYVLVSWLKRGGYTVVEAETGAQALDRFEQGDIDLVVLDVRLPDASGFEICQRIKEHPRFGTTPVIHVSAAAVESVDRTHGLSGGADGYLVEPINPDELLATIASVLRYYQARLQAERLAARLTSLVHVTADMGAATSQRRLLEQAARGGSEIFDSAVTIFTGDRDGAWIMATCAGRGEAAEVRPATMELGDEPIGITIRDEAADRWPALRTADAEVRVAAFHTRPEQPAVYVVMPSSASLTDSPVLTLFGQAIVAAIESQRLFASEHNLALTLQRSLLPRRVPRLSGFDLAVRYVPASDHAEIGGDFYEVTQQADRIVIAVGDVGGHSLHAATVMAELRHATRAYLIEGYSPATILDRLNILIGALLPGEIATMCVIAISWDTGEVLMSNAGHPPPMLHGADGARLLHGHGPLLGIHVRPATESSFTLAPGDTLVLYTDGLIERRGEILDIGLERLVAAAGTPEPDLEQYASRLLDELVPEVPSDDIALVAIRRRAIREAAPDQVFTHGYPPIEDVIPPAGAATFVVDTPSLSRLRQAMSAFGQENGLDVDGQDRLVLAANELLTNAIRHGGGGGRMWLWRDEAWFFCQVTDQGRGFTDLAAEAGAPQAGPRAMSGRGLWLVRQLMGRVLVRSGPSGTTVTAALPIPNA